MRRTGLHISLVGFLLLAGCQAGDNLLLAPAPVESAGNQTNTLGPARPQDDVPAFPQNQTIPDADQNPAPDQNQIAQSQQGAPQPINPGAASAAGPSPAPQQTASGDEGENGDNGEGAPATGDGGVAGPDGAAGVRQGSLSQAASREAPQNSATRAVIEPSRGLFGNQFDRQVNAILGSSQVGINTESDIKSEMVVGNWSLSEEDGLRSCVMGFIEAEEANGVQVDGGCSAEILGIRSWGLFGEDLLLRDSQNSVVVRLRRSGESWVGFTLQAGIPIILSRG